MRIKESVMKMGKFQNPIPTNEVVLADVFPMLKAYITNEAENVPKKTLGPFKTDTSIYSTPPKSGLRITWVGHSSLLIEIDGKCILTDPVWSERASFSSFFGPRRFFQPPVKLGSLPPLDAIIISHDHYDHLDKNTIKYYAGKHTQFICSLKVGKYLKKWGIIENFITQIDWGESVMIGGHDCIITATPSRHFSGRGIVNRNTTLWSSFVIRGKKHKIFFGADSGWFPGFADIGTAYGPFDLTILEIGAYGQYWPDIHMGPDNASNASIALKGNMMMPIHWGTFNLALHAWYEPIERLVEYGKSKNIKLFIPKPGEPTEVQELNSEWWVPFLSTES